MAMTSIYYTECGHWGRRDLSGSSRSRERYAESLGEGELCPDCKREALLKKREAEQAEAVKAAEEKNWPDLLGSEKQIAWATTIRVQVVNGDKDNYCFIYKDKVYKLKREAVSGIVGSVLVKEKIDSRFWIDNRNSIETIRQKTVKEFSDKYADEFTEILKAAEEIELKYVYIEVFASNRDLILEKCQERFTSVHIDDSFYCHGRKNKCWIVRAGNEEAPHPDKNIDEEHYIRWICNNVDYNCIADPCMGKGNGWILFQCCR